MASAARRATPPLPLPRSAIPGAAGPAPYRPPPLVELWRGGVLMLCAARSFTSPGSALACAIWCWYSGLTAKSPRMKHASLRTSVKLQDQQQPTENHQEAPQTARWHRFRLFNAAGTGIQDRHTVKNKRLMQELMCATSASSGSSRMMCNSLPAFAGRHQALTLRQQAWHGHN